MHPTGQENFVPAVASSHAASLVPSSAIFQPGSFLNVEPQCPEDQYGNISRLSFSQDRSVYVRESPSTNCEGKNASETDLCRDRSLMLFLEPCSGTFKSSESQKILSVGLETLEGISKPCYAENSQQTHMQAAGTLQDAISRDQNMFARDSSFKSKVALEDGCSEAVMPQQSFSKMNHFERQAHVAQQLRRDKLRIPGSYHSSPPRAGNQIQRSAFSLLPMQQHAQQDVEIIQQSDISERSGSLKGYAQRCVGQTASGELLSVYTNNEGAVATDEYNYPVGLELLSVPSGGGNLLKTSVSDVFQTPPESVPFHASQPVQRGDYNGQSNAVSQKWTISNFMDSSNQQGNINTLGNFGVSQPIQGVQAPERSHTVNNCWTSSVLTDSTIQEGLLSTSARCGSLGSHKPSSKTSDESLQVPHLIRNGLAGYTDPLNLRNLAVSMTHNSNPFANNMQHQQQYERMSFVPSTISHKASVVQPFMADISSSAHERLCSNPNILCSGGEYGYCSKWSNRGTELLLLPGNDVLENSQARSSDMHNSILGSSPIYGVGQGALPYVQWERQDLVSGRDGRIIPMEAFGSLRQGQGLSLSLSGQQQFPCDFYGFDTRMPHSGSFNILRNSKYSKAAQQLLQEICNVGKGLKRNAPTQMISNSEAFENASSDPIAKGDSCSIETSCRKEGGTSVRAVSYVDAISEPASHQMHPEEKGRLQLKKTRLVAMVEEVDRRYGQYQEQMQMVMTSFESATGLGAAAPYTSLARQAMSRHFRCLRDAISDQIQGICKDLGEEPSNVPVLNKGETPRLRILDQKLRHQRALQQIGMLQHQAWRPQRGLPERAVSVLRAWLFEHFLHPYPKDTEKHMLARQTGLTRSQVSNWFINARVRLWKPMVEEMYLEESKDSEVEGTQAPATKRVNNGAKNKGQQVGVDPCMTQEVTKSPTSNQERRGSNDGASCSHTRPRVSDHDYASDPNTSESEFAAEARRSEETATELTTVGAQPFQTAMESTTLNNGQKGMNFYGSSRLVITNASGKDGDMQYEGEVGERSGKMYRSHANYERSRAGREDHNGGVSVQDIANLESGCNRGFRDSSSHSAMGWRFMRNGGGDEEA